MQDGLSCAEDIHLTVVLKFLIYLLENCYQEVVSLNGVLEKVFYYLIELLLVNNRSRLIKSNALHLMCVWLFVDAQSLITIAFKQKQIDNIFFQLFGDVELFDENNQREELLLGIVGLIRLPKNYFPETIPLASLMREALNCVSSICNSRLENHKEGTQELQNNMSSGAYHDTEEDLEQESDEDDDDWNEEMYIREEIQFEYESPLFYIDSVLELENALQEVQNKDSEYCKVIIDQLSPNERASLTKMFNFAKKNNK
jgi:hypothetical protein